MSFAMDLPYHPDRSVVVYSLAPVANESLNQTVRWLLEDVLGVTVKVKAMERTQARDANNQAWSNWNSIRYMRR